MALINSTRRKWIPGVIVVFVIQCSLWPLYFHQHVSVEGIGDNDFEVVDWQTNAVDGEYMGRKIGKVFSDIGRLKRPSRNRDEKVEDLIKLLLHQITLSGDRATSGVVCADVGSGPGYVTWKLATICHRVIALDPQQKMVDAMKSELTLNGLTNVDPKLGFAADLPVGGIDLVVVVDVYHEVEDPVEFLTDIRRALRPSAPERRGGLLVLVEYRAEDPDVRLAEEHKMSKVQMNKELLVNGFVLAGESDYLPRQHVMMYTSDIEIGPTLRNTKVPTK